MSRQISGVILIPQNTEIKSSEKYAYQFYTTIVMITTFKTVHLNFFTEFSKKRSPIIHNFCFCDRKLSVGLLNSRITCYLSLPIISLLLDDRNLLKIFDPIPLSAKANLNIYNNIRSVVPLWAMDAKWSVEVNPKWSLEVNVIDER